MKPVTAYPGGASPVDFIAPVPLSAEGLRKRGFNQALLIAREVSRALGVPVSTDVLIKHRHTPPQVGLSAEERRKNVKGAFSMLRGLQGERVLIIDDVVTTTATARECAGTLLKGGAGEVRVASVTRARGG